MCKNKGRAACSSSFFKFLFLSITLLSFLHQIGTQGDYSVMVIDPTDDCTFYYVNEYYTTTSSKGWQTKIAAFQLDNCNVGATVHEEHPMRSLFDVASQPFT
jgi:hypothetical protein